MTIFSATALAAALAGTPAEVPPGRGAESRPAEVATGGERVASAAADHDELVGPLPQAAAPAEQAPPGPVPGDDPDTRVVVIRIEEHTASCGGPDITWQSAGDGSLEVKVDVHEHSMEYAVISNSYRRGRSLGFGGRRLKNGGVR